MNTTPKVSVITCFLNVAAFLPEAVQSVLKQTYSNWELLLIDDGSTDGSTELAMAWAKQYPQQIFYYHHPGHANHGLSASRNLGIKKATGELIAFLDADDVYLPHYLALQVQLIQQHNVALVCEATMYWNTWRGKQFQDVVLPVGAPPGLVYHPPQLALLLYPLGKGAAPCTCGILVKKEVLVKHGGFDNRFKGMYEEQIPLSKFYLNEKIFVSAACNNHYRQRPNSLVGHSKKNRRAYLAVRHQFLEWLERYLAENNVQDGHLSRLLRKAFVPYRQPFLYFFTGTIPAGITAVKKKARSSTKRLIYILCKQLRTK